MNLKTITTLCALTVATMSFADSGLVKGAAFIDRFLPIEPQNLSNKSWGADNVQPRDINNGIEDKEYSYWGGNIIKGDDGKYHMFVARWPENSKKGNGVSGHHLWWSSEVAHAIADKPIGPYKVKEVVGKGHNPEIYQAKDGTYYIGVMGEKAYKSKSLNGPWEQIEAKFDFFKKVQNKTNRTYIVDKKKGDIYMMNKEGWVFTSKGNEEFVEIPVTSPAYTRRFGSHEEDPVIWKDEIQYNLIVNDCTHRTAYHLTSPDGKKWTYEDGIAYTPHILKHKGGRVEKWDKLERPKILTDKYSTVLLEGAGGLMVPITTDSSSALGGYLTIDYIAEHNYPVILVTSGKLGSLNHTLLSIDACNKRGIEIALIVYNEYPSTDAIIEKSSLKYLESLNIPVVLLSNCQ